MLNEDRRPRPQDRRPPVLLKATWDHFSFFSQLSEEHAAQLISRMVVCPVSTVQEGMQTRGGRERKKEKAHKPGPKGGAHPYGQDVVPAVRILSPFLSLSYPARVAQTVKTYRKGDYIIRKGTIGTSVVC